MAWHWTVSNPLLNTLRLRQKGRHFPDVIFKCIFLNDDVWILIKISLKFVPKGPINNVPALVQIMAWRRPGIKLLSEPVFVSLLTHICITQPQQSGTKPNLVVKIWLPTLVTICNGLPKLVASISSHIHHLVNTRLAVGSLVKWLPI